MKTAEALMEMFTDSLKLLHRVTKEQIHVFVNLITQVGQLSRYMSFMLAMIKCHGHAVMENQDHVWEFIQQKNILLQDRVDGENVEINLKSVMFLKTNEDWIPLYTFITRCLSKGINYSTREDDIDLLRYYELGIESESHEIFVISSFEFRVSSFAISLCLRAYAYFRVLQQWPVFALIVTTPSLRK
jgi:hypothetical protein